MRTLSIARLALLVASLLVAESPAQEYPVRPIRIVTSPIGGSPDYVARVIAQAISAPLGQNIIIDNRPNGIIQAQIVASAPPDGYTLLVVSNVLWIEPLMKEAPYDAVKDFLPITLTNRSTLIVAVHASLAITSVKELNRAYQVRQAAGARGYEPQALGAAARFAERCGIDSRL